MRERRWRFHEGLRMATAVTLEKTNSSGLARFETRVMRFRIFRDFDARDMDLRRGIIDVDGSIYIIIRWGKKDIHEGWVMESKIFFISDMLFLGRFFGLMCRVDSFMIGKDDFNQTDKETLFEIHRVTQKAGFVRYGYWQDLIRCLLLKIEEDSMGTIYKDKNTSVCSSLLSSFSFSFFKALKEFKFLKRVVAIFNRGVSKSQFGANKGKGLVRTVAVRLSAESIARRVEQFALTVIERLMNPDAQQMDSLLANIPKIWEMEGRVIGGDLRNGKFQFNFQAEEDLVEVLRQVPYHFDGCMVSLVCWKPSGEG